MSGKARLVLLVVALAACGRGDGPSALAFAKAPVPKPPPRPTLSVGQPLEEALDELHAAKARDISADTGIFRPVPLDETQPRYESRWFILRDGTCLEVHIRRENATGKPIIARLELGEEGKGFKAKDPDGSISWSGEREKHRYVKRLELP